jgi:hypothetical protein
MINKIVAIASGNSIASNAYKEHQHMNIYPDRTPYTYLIGWSKLDKWYYGVRFAKKCHPSDLWVSYFTSSKYVKNIRKQEGEPDVIEIRKIFSSHQDAIKWEEKVLRRLNVLNNDKWINKNVAGAIAPMPGELNPRYGKGKSAEEIEKLRKSNKGRKASIETRKKQSLARMGKPGTPHTPETKKRLSENRVGKYTGSDNPFYGKTHTEEVKDMLRDKRKNKTFEELFGDEKAEKMKSDISKRMTGENHHFYNKEVSPERKKNISKGVIDNRVYICCIICKKQSDYSNYVRWHLNRKCDAIKPSPETRRITDGTTERRISKDTVLPDGWRYGRKNKKI